MESPRGVRAQRVDHQVLHAHPRKANENDSLPARVPSGVRVRISSPTRDQPALVVSVLAHDPYARVPTVPRPVPVHDAMAVWGPLRTVALSTMSEASAP